MKNPPVECIDLVSYETMLRLEESGLLEFSAARQDFLFRREDEDPQIAAASRNREIAGRLLDEAERFRKMAELLVGGGFEAEADAQSKNIVANAVQALAAMFDSEDFENQGDEKDIHRICDRLADQDRITREMQFKVLWLTADTNESGTTAKLSEAIGMLEFVRSVIKD